jgi:glycosyltransferase involved in cell wall biosynthesis
MAAGFRHAPDLYMGYHIMPCAVMALLAGRAFGRPVSYQMTGGPIEVLGGGIASENPVLRRLGPSGVKLEGLAMALIREFDQVVVRGEGARRFLIERGVPADRIAIIPGSVDPRGIEAQRERTYDLVSVGRLAELKQPLQFVEILARVYRTRPEVRGLVIGDGPLLPAMRERARALGVAERLEFAGKTDRVLSLLGQSRIFVLNSRTEGLSIAMAEAMMAGTVPVVANVGDLSDLVRPGINGYLVPPNDIEAYVARVQEVLAEPRLWSRLSEAAMASARGYVGLDHVTALWSQHIEGLFQRVTAEEIARLGRTT